MWTREELKEIRENAELSASQENITPLWQSACLEMASAADRLDSIISRIEKGEIRALKQPILQPAIVA